MTANFRKGTVMKALALLILATTAGAFDAAAQHVAQADPCKNYSMEGKCREINDARCRNAIDSMRAMMQDTPAKTERERQDLDELRSRVDKLIREDREKGVHACKTWGGMQGIIVKY